MSQAKLTKPSSTPPSSGSIISDALPTELFSDPTMTPLLGVAVLLIIILIIINIFKPTSKNKIANARWASKREIAAGNKKGMKTAAMKDLTNPVLWISEPIGAAYPRMEDLPHIDGVTYFNRAAQAIGLIGGSGYGKTKTLLDPLLKAAMERGDSIMLVDPKFPTQASQIIAHARKCGYEIKVFAPSENFPESDSFNLFDMFVGLKDPSLQAISACATILGNVNAKGGKSAKGDPFFDENAPKVAACAMMLANWISKKLDRPDLNTIPFGYAVLSAEGLIKRLRHNIDDIPFGSQILASSVLKANSDKTEGSLLATAEKILSYFTVPALIPSCGKAGNFPGFFPDEPLKMSGKQLCIFGIDQDISSVVIPIVCAAVEVIGSYNLNNSRPRTNNLVLCMDEFPALYLPIIKAWLAEKRSMGLITLMAAQTPEQFDEKYGQGSAKGFMDRLGSVIYMNPNSFDAAEQISKLLGEEQIMSTSKGQSSNTGRSGGSTNTNQSPHKRRLITPEEILQMPEGSCIIRNSIVRSVNTPFADEKQKIPYCKRFEINDHALKKEESFAAKEYQKLSQKAAFSNQHKQQTDKELRDMFKEYRGIIDVFLPLPPKEEPAPKAPLGRSVMLAQVIGKIRNDGFHVTGNLTDRKVIIPEHFSNELTIAECQEILHNEGVEYAEFASH
jgi:type IV secretory pathway TraG/TraD family ATPase VirD4